MLKMFSTQLAGLFKRIQEQNEFSFEDGARLLAQAAASSAGAIYICGFGEMGAVEMEACYGAEPLAFVKKWDDIQDITVADRVVLFSRFSNDGDAIALAQSLVAQGIPFVAVATDVEAAGLVDKKMAVDDLTKLADVFIDLKLAKGLLPDESGNRVGYPAAMAGLFVFHGLKFTLEEILADFN